jgi:hypothetical protein
MPKMFSDKIKNTGIFFPSFKVEKEELAETNLRKSIKLTFYSRINSESEWQTEYTKIYPLSYNMLNEKMNMIEKIIKENYYRFRSKIFENVQMFAINGVMFKINKLDYENKLVYGTIIEKELLKYLPFNEETAFDIIDNKGGLRFFSNNEVAGIDLSNDTYNYYYKGERVTAEVYDSMREDENFDFVYLKFSKTNGSYIEFLD